jgi:hypothetical protein
MEDVEGEADDSSAGSVGGKAGESSSADDGGAEAFMEAMRRLAEERRRRQIRDNNRVDAHCLRGMRRAHQRSDQCVLAVAARASAATEAFLTRVTADSGQLARASQAVSTSAEEELPEAVRAAVAGAAKEMHAFQREAAELTRKASRERAARQQRRRVETAAALKRATVRSEGRLATETKLEGVISLLESLAE